MTALTAAVLGLAFAAVFYVGREHKRPTEGEWLEVIAVAFIWPFIVICGLWLILRNLLKPPPR